MMIVTLSIYFLKSESFVYHFYRSFINLLVKRISLIDYRTAGKHEIELYRNNTRRMGLKYYY